MTVHQSHESNTGTPDILHLGSGMKYMKGALNVDVTPDTGPDLVANLNQRPWDLPDSSFREILAFDVIEHLDDVVGTLEQIHRVGRPGAVVKMTVPHFSSDGAFTDPTHRKYFGARTFDYFTEGHPCSFYTKARFRVRHRQLVFRPTFANRVIHRLANRFLAPYEERWAWIFPAWFVYIELEVVKS